MNRIAILAFIAGGLLIAGCDEPPKPGTSPQGQTPAVEIKDDELPTPADFDDEAEKQITEANYKAELDSLEKEIATE